MALGVQVGRQGHVQAVEGEEAAVEQPLKEEKIPI